jgi:hypothetical protein
VTEKKQWSESLERTRKTLGTNWELSRQTGPNIQILRNFPSKCKYSVYLENMGCESTLGLYAHVAIAACR